MSYIWTVKIGNHIGHWGTYKGVARSLDEAGRKAKKKAKLEGCTRPVVFSAVREEAASW